MRPTGVRRRSWTTDTGGNGNDDGRFLVAVKVSGPTGGLWHYEYAVHNLDNSRGGASLRIPVDAAATVQNAGFRDIDADPLNDWSFARSPTEIAFTASATNPLDWDTIYNCCGPARGRCSRPAHRKPRRGAVLARRSFQGAGESVDCPAHAPVRHR